MNASCKDLQDAAAIWSMLDTLAEQNPEKYKEFIRKTLKDGERQGMSAPKEFQYLATEKIPSVIPRRKFYINIAQWSQVPYHKESTNQCQFIIGDIRDEIIQDSHAFILDVAGHPNMMSDILSSPETSTTFYKQLLHLVERQKSLKLSSNYKVNEGYIGNRDCLFNFMCPGNLVADAKGVINNMSTTAELSGTLNQTCSRSAKEEKLIPDGVHDEKKEQGSLLSIVKEKKLKNGLDNKRTTKGPIVPRHTLELKPSLNGLHRKMKLEVELPGITSVNECDLELFEDSMRLNAANIYAVEVPLPCKVDEDKTRATFIKGDSKLVVTMVSE